MRRQRPLRARAFAIHAATALSVPFGTGCASVLGDDYEIISSRRSVPIFDTSVGVGAGGGGQVLTGAGGGSACGSSADAGTIAAGGASACENEATCSACGTCGSNGPCSAEDAACVASSDCLNASMCATACASDTTCFQACLAAPGGDLLESYLSCLVCVCQKPCATQ